MELIIGVLVFTISLVTSLSVVKPVYPEKSEAVLWQETGLNPDQLSSFLTNHNCHENEKKFLACINAIGKISKEQKLRFLPPGKFVEYRLWISEKNSLIPWQKFYKENPNQAKTINFESLWEKELLTKIPKEYHSLMTASGINGYLSVFHDPHTYIMPRPPEGAKKEETVYLAEKEFELNYETIVVEKFEEGTCSEFKKVLEEVLKETPSIYLIFIDLQDNPGGYVPEAVCIASLLVGKKKIVELKPFNAIKQPEIYFGQEEQMYWGHLVLLMNSASASASELLAGSLKSYDRVSIAGERSYGKGTYQETVSWRSNQRIWFRQTQGYFLSPTGTSPQLQGIVPDHPIEEKTKYHREPDLFLYPLDAPVSYLTEELTTK